MRVIRTVFAVLMFWANLWGQFVPGISSSASDDAASVILNPAGLGISRQFHMLVLGPTDMTRLDSAQNDFSGYFQWGRTGFGYTYMADSRDLFHWGSGEHLWGGLYLGGTSHFSRDGYEAVDLGMMFRGFSRASAAVTWKNLWSRQREGNRRPYQLGVGVGLRPLGNRLTLAYDHRVSLEAETLEGFQDLGGSIQLLTEPFDGVRLFASYELETEFLQLGVGLDFGKAGVETYHDLDRTGQYGSSLLGFQTSREIRHTLFLEKEPTFVVLSFDKPITDSPTPKSLFGPSENTLKDLRDRIRDLARDPGVEGIILRPDTYQAGGIGMMEELVRELKDFKHSGKAIYAFMDMGGDLEYALGCVADSIYLNSGGFLAVDGLAFSIGFLKALFDKIGVDAQFYRRGDYKTEAEPYTRRELTETSREAYEAVLADMHEVFSRIMREGRGWSPEKLDAVYKGGMYTPSMAVEAGLVDGVYHPDEIEKKMKKIAGNKVKIVNLNHRPRPWAYAWKGHPRSKIALIYAEGPIVPGKSRPSPFGGDKMIGSETTAKAIRQAREDKSTKAIVMRVNSPGGSALASEDIWREVHRTTHPDSSDREHRKPFVISMANVAASGGYYISCAADTIVADEGTVTGSIGVLSGKLSFGGLYDKIGYDVEIIKEQPHAEQFRAHRPFTEEEGIRMQAIVDGYYEMFLQRVAEGRGMTPEEVDAIAQGRIWSGIDARDIGLIDVVGGLDVAVDIAREKAGLKEGAYDLHVFEGVEPWKFQFDMEERAGLIELVKRMDPGIPLSRVLDRVHLLQLEPVLYLMDAELILED